MAEVEKAQGTVFQSESILSAWEDAIPLMIANQQETGAFPHHKFAPAREKLERMENAGFLRCFTARRDGKLIGYQLFFILFSIDYPDNLEAISKAVYVSLEHRGFTAGKFLYWVDAQLEREGISVIGRQSTTKHPMDKVYHRMGYRKVEELWVWERGGDC